MTRDDSHIQAMLHQAACLESEVATQKLRPFMLIRPQVYQDGDQWCALYGPSIMEGVVGFGRSPDDASYAFDKAWYEKLEADENSDPVLSDPRVVAARGAIRAMQRYAFRLRHDRTSEPDLANVMAIIRVADEALAALEVKP